MSIAPFGIRYKSIAVLDTEALLATCAYIDLNPVAAGIAELPEESAYDFVRPRVEHGRQKGGGGTKLPTASSPPL